MTSPKQPLTPTQAMNRAAALCARSEQAPGDIRKKLISWGLNPCDVTQVLQQLSKQGYIDEKRFASAFVNDRFNFNGWGRIKIAYQLRQKAISGEIIDEVLAVIDEAAYRQRLIELLQAKWRTVKEREPRAAWAAMMRFAASRGFEARISGECVKLVTRLDVEDD